MKVTIPTPQVGLAFKDLKVGGVYLDRDQDVVLVVRDYEEDSNFLVYLTTCWDSDGCPISYDQDHDRDCGPYTTVHGPAMIESGDSE